MHRPLALVAAVALVLVSCGGAVESAEHATAAPQAPETTAAPAPTATAPPVPPSTAPAEEVEETTPDVAVFIAAINESTVGTRYENAALEDPEVFIGVGQLFCELLTAGETIDGVLAEYLDALADDTGRVAEEDALVAGVLMGASVEVLCPEHRQADAEAVS